MEGCPRLNTQHRQVSGKGSCLNSLTKRVPIEIEPGPENRKYLLTKCKKLGHLMHILED